MTPIVAASEGLEVSKRLLLYKVLDSIIQPHSLTKGTWYNFACYPREVGLDKTVGLRVTIIISTAYTVVAQIPGGVGNKDR